VLWRNAFCPETVITLHKLGR